MPRQRKRSHGEGTIFQRKDGRWQGAITLGYGDAGQQKRKTVYGKTQAEVREKLATIKRRHQERTLVDTRQTVRSYFESWLEHKALEVKPRTVEYYRTYARRHIYPQIGGVRLSQLTTPRARTLLIRIHDAVSADAANKTRTVLHAALRQAMRDGLIPRNPIEPIRKFKTEPKTQDRTWTPDEAVAFLETAQGDRLFAAFYLAMSTGMRHGEVLGLRWQDVQEDTITVRQALVLIRGSTMMLSTPKTEAGVRRIAVDPETLSVLEEHRRRQEEERALVGEGWGPSSEEFADLVFTTQLGGPMHPRNLDRTWYRLRKKAGVSPIRFHDLRHMHVSLLNKAGLDARTIADRIGHTDPAFTLKRYAHVFEEQRRAAAIPLLELLSTPGSGSDES